VFRWLARSLYVLSISRHSPWSQADLLGLVAQLPSPNLLLGDFNAHHTLWGCRNTDSKGQEVADFLLSSNLCLFNGKTPTYIHQATGASSSIDLALGDDPSLYLDYSFTVHGDSCGSDHFPVILKSARPGPVSGVQRWKLRSANWESAKCTLELHYEYLTGISDPVEAFTSKLVDIANLTA
jgi:hypothetical protein